MATLGRTATSSQPAVLVLWTALYRYIWAVLPIVIITRFLVRRHLSPLRKYPGPFLASGSRVWKVWSTYSGHTETDHIHLHKKYGPVVRIAPNELSFSSPHAARDIFTVGKGFRKTDFYGVFPPPENPDIFTEMREAVHAQKKRVAATPYSMAAMQQLSGFVDDTEQLLLEKLDGFVGQGSSCNLGDWLHYFAFDVLGEMAFSRKFGFLAAGVDVDGCIKAIDDSQWYNGIVGQVPLLDHFLRRNPLWQYVPFLATKNALITQIALAELEKRKQSGKNSVDRKDLLSQLLTASQAQPDKFGGGDVFAVAHGAIFAGSDSTASTMQSFIYHILKSPSTYSKICEEIDAADAAGNLSAMITYAEAQQLPYFQAALKEAMRVRPAVGLNITRHVPPSGAEIDGQWYPGDTRVALNAWVLHKDKAVFGDDAEVFRPERWLEGAEAKVKRMDRYMYQFGGGSHLCIGRNLAILEMNKVLPQILRRYRFRLVHPEATIKHHSTFFVVQSGLEVYIEKRTESKT